MSIWMKALLSVTGAVVLAMAGWWGWLEWTSARERAAAREQVAGEEAAVEQAARESAVAGDLEAMECRLDVERWDTGRRAEVEAKYGEDAEAVVEGCRAVVTPPAP